MAPSLRLTLAALGIALPLIATPHSAYAQAPSSTSELLKELNWRCIGPAIMGGRIDDFAVVESDPKTYYVGTAAGGIFKTTNNGTTFESVFDHQVTASIGDIAIAPSNPDTVYVGTGEANNRQSSTWGYGMYKSTDAGKTWTHLGLEKTQHIGRVLVHPTNPDVVYVAALGRLWGPNPERGLYKSTDGGKTWNKSLYINDDTGVTDIVMDPTNPEVIYAATYTRRRTAFGFVGGSKDGGLYKSTDGGKTWTKLKGGLPEGEVGRIGIAIYPKNPQILYITVESDNKGGTQSPRGNGYLWRTVDGGQTWERRSETNPRPMYFSQVRVDPNDAEKVYVTGVQTQVSTDGGKTFNAPWSQVHADGHALWINPNDSNHLLFGCDGGIQVSYDRGRRWDFLNHIVCSQFYEVHFDFRLPYHVYGGLQDNGTWEAPSRTLDARGVTNDEWLNVGGGDGFYAQADPTDPNIIYTESQGGAMARLNQFTGERKSIRPRPENPSEVYRFDWNTPILISPHNPKKLLVAANRLFISYDRGDNWRRTDDLTAQTDRNKLPIMGKPVAPTTLSRHDGQDSFSEIVTVSESPAKEGVLWVGTDDGNLQVSQDDGKTWKLISVPGVPKGTYVSRVHASPFAPGRCYVCFDGHRSDDFTPYAFVTEDFGATWRPVTNGLPEGATTHALRDHPRTENLLFLGTERGVYVSFDRGGHWERFGAPFPSSIPVNDLQIHPRDNDLILATHARGIWVLDDLGAFEAQARGLGAITLAPPKPAIPYRIASRKAIVGHKIYIAPNPANGTSLQLYVGSVPKEKIQLQILDAKGKVVRDLQPSGLETGWNAIRWDIRENPAIPPQTGGGGGNQGGGPGGGGGGFGGGGFGAAAPRVLPGTYTVKLTIGGVVQTQPIQVFDDPRAPITDKERVQIHDTLALLRDTFRDLDIVRRQLTAEQADLNLRPESPARNERLKAIEAMLAKVVPSTARPNRGGGGGQRSPRTQPQPGESGGGESSEAQTPPPTPAGPPSVSTRIARLSQTIDSFTTPITPANLKEAGELVKEAKKLIGEAKRLKLPKLESEE